MADPMIVQETKSTTRFEIKRYGYVLVLEVSADGVECHCVYEPATTGGAPLTGEELQGLLTQYKICEGILPEATAELVNAAACGKAVSGLLLGSGRLMIPGEDGKLVLAVSNSLASAAADEDEESGTIDLRNVQSFLNVEVGQLVATILEPGPGVPGRTVFGKVIPPQPGSPLKLVPGLNVRLGDHDRNIYSEAVGRVCVRGDEISVEDVYEIDGDVDFKVGNIMFKGFVEIKGDVLDGFSVKSTGGIKVHGIIGVCNIESDGDIFFSGMNGRSNGTITCGGSITANYIYETSIECAGDITVDVEVRNAQIRCLGALRVNRRGISGGECFALAGIESVFIGNVVSLRTLVAAGVHYHDLVELNSLFNELKQLIAAYNDTPKESVDPKEFAGKRAAITGRIQEVRQRAYSRCNPKINVHRVLYEGVVITLGTMSENIGKERKGPLTVIQNTIEGGFRYLGLTDLQFKAQTIEETFIRQYQLDQKKQNLARTGDGA